MKKNVFFNQNDDYNVSYTSEFGSLGLKQNKLKNVKINKIRKIFNENILGFINIKNINSGEVNKFTKEQLKNKL